MKVSKAATVLLLPRHLLMSDVSYSSTGSERCLQPTTYCPGSWCMSSSRCWETSWTKRTVRKRRSSRYSPHSSSQWRLGQTATTWGRALSRPQCPTVESNKERRYQQYLDTWTVPCDAPVHSQPIGTAIFQITMKFLSGPRGPTALHCEDALLKLLMVLSITRGKHI